MNWDAIINGAVGAGVLSIILKLIDTYSNRNKTRADAAKTIVEGGEQAVNTMRGLLQDYDHINDEQRTEIEKLQTRLIERDKVNATRDTEFAELQQKYEDLEAHHIRLVNQLRDTDAKIKKDTEETQKLRDEVEQLRKRAEEIEQKYQKQLKVNVRLVKALEDANIPLPDVNGDDLGDSIRGFRWEDKK
jgi:chromosome segregation ATPase